LKLNAGRAGTKTYGADFCRSAVDHLLGENSIYALLTKARKKSGAPPGGRARRNGTGTDTRLRRGVWKMRAIRG